MVLVCFLLFFTFFFDLLKLKKWLTSYPNELCFNWLIFQGSPYTQPYPHSYLAILFFLSFFPSYLLKGPVGKRSAAFLLWLGLQEQADSVSAPA